jgi:hypothetical protein
VPERWGAKMVVQNKARPQPTAIIEAIDDWMGDDD